MHRSKRQAQGTEVTFLPSPVTFTKTEFDYATLEHRLRELAFLNSGVTHRAHRSARRRDQGRARCIMKAASKPLCTISTAPRTLLIPSPVMIHGERDGMTVEIAHDLER